MADYVTSILDWTTAGTNTPLNSDDINGNGTSQYATLANMFRDVKGAIRGESLNLGFDPSTTYTNVGSSVFVKDASDDTNKVVFIVNADLKKARITEGQMFSMSIYVTDKWVYYSGYVAALDKVSGTQWKVYPSGLTRWAASTSDSDSSGLTPALVSSFDATDWGKIGDHSPTHGKGYNTLSFSAYAPRSGLSYLNTSVDDISNLVPLSFVPLKEQVGTFVIAADKKTAAVCLPHKEPNSEYTVNLTPLNRIHTAGTTINKDSFKVESIKKSRSIFVVSFRETAGTYRTEWNWKISRSY